MQYRCEQLQGKARHHVSIIVLVCGKELAKHVKQSMLRRGERTSVTFCMCCISARRFESQQKCEGIEIVFPHTFVYSVSAHHFESWKVSQGMKAMLCIVCLCAGTVHNAVRRKDDSTTPSHFQFSMTSKSRRALPRRSRPVGS